MFRDYDLKYLIPYVILLLTLTGLDIWYEIAHRTGDSWPETLIAIGNGASSAVSVTFILFATVEGIVYMVLAMWRLRKLREENEQKLKAAEEAAKGAVEKGREEGREQGREEGREEERRRWREEERRRWRGRGGGRRRGPPGCLLTNRRRRNGNRRPFIPAPTHSPPWRV